MPGWATGGPNGSPTGADPLLAAVIAEGTPPAKCYVDQCTAVGSYASNEGETSDNGALVLATGFFVEGAGDAGSDAAGDAGSDGVSDAGSDVGAAHRSGGCACETRGEASSAAPLAWLVAGSVGGAWLVVRGRRRRARLR